MDGIAEVDPGADADVNAPPADLPAITVPSTQPDDVADDVGDSVRLGVLIVAAAIAVPVPPGGNSPPVGLAEAARSHRGPGDDRAWRRARRLVALGEEIQALDLDVEMPDASAVGREEYERALRLYDRANQLLRQRDPSEVELYEAPPPPLARGRPSARGSRTGGADGRPRHLTALKVRPADHPVGGEAPRGAARSPHAAREPPAVLLWGVHIGTLGRTVPRLNAVVSGHAMPATVSRRT